MGWGRKNLKSLCRHAFLNIMLVLVFFGIQFSYHFYFVIIVKQKVFWSLVSITLILISVGQCFVYTGVSQTDLSHGPSKQQVFILWTSSFCAETFYISFVYWNAVSKLFKIAWRHLWTIPLQQATPLKLIVDSVLLLITN